MKFGYAIAGLLAGIFIAGSHNFWLLAAITGTVIGILLARIVDLDRRVKQYKVIGPA